MSLVETPFFLQRGRHRLFAMLRAPKKSPKQNIIICQSLGEEQIQSYGYLARLSRALANQGWAVLNFDYLGTGDSEGDFYQQVQLASLGKDLVLAYEYLHAKNPEKTFGVICLGLGLMTALFWLKKENIKPEWLIAWAPVLRGEKFIRNAKRQLKISRLITKTKALPPDRKNEFVLEGFQWSGQLVQQITDYNAMAWAQALPLQNYWFDFTVTGEPSPESKQAADDLKALNRPVELIGFKTLPFWKNMHPDQNEISRAIEKTCEIAGRKARP